MIVWRAVVRYERIRVPWGYAFGHYGASSVNLYLSCGHVKYQKGSRPIPKKARCWECEMGSRP